MNKPLSQECPTCFADLRGAPIPNTNPVRYYSHLIHVELPYIFDGTLFYECPNCETRYHRFAPESNLYQRADWYVRKLEPELIQRLLTLEVKGDVVLEDGGKLYNVHNPASCAPGFCSLHRPSDHLMKDFPRTWRKRLVYRVCSHQVAHPDPDALAWMHETLGGVAAMRAERHLCCGFACCQEPFVNV